MRKSKTADRPVGGAVLRKLKEVKEQNAAAAGASIPAQVDDAQILHYFRASEWRNMLSESATIGTVLDTILGRVYLLGGINLNEYTSKFLSALLMHVQRIVERNDH